MDGRGCPGNQIAEECSPVRPRASDL